MTKGRILRTLHLVVEVYCDREKDVYYYIRKVIKNMRDFSPDNYILTTHNFTSCNILNFGIYLTAAKPDVRPSEVIVQMMTVL